MEAMEAMEAMEPPLLTQTRGQVAVLTLNRPGRLNAIGRDVLALLAAAVAEAGLVPQVRLGIGEPLVPGTHHPLTLADTR